MLVLTRKVNQAIDISGPGRIVVTDVKGTTVKLGFIAAPDVKVLRSELEPKPPQPKAA